MIKRKTILVDRAFQLKYAGWILAVMLFTIILIIGNSMRFIAMHRDMFNAMPGSLAAVIGLVKFLILVLIIFGVLVSLWAMYASHKYAGPVYRFKKILDDLAQGDLTTRAFLRKDDELNDMRDSMNKAIIGIYNRIRQDKDTLQQALYAVQDIQKKLQEPLQEQTILIIKEKLNEIEKNIHETRNQFKT